MPRVVITEGAAQGLERCRLFLIAKSLEATQRAGNAIQRHLLQLDNAPDIGRPLPDAPELREVVIPFGDSGYIGLYRHETAENAVYVLAFRHQREAGY